jgi:glyoxalase/bleomycin resistance protein/dioxygenase superfamily protein
MPGYGDRTDTAPVPMPGRPPDQVAYVVRDLEEGVWRLGRQFGVSRWLGWRYTADYLPQRVFRGQPGDFESHGVIPEYGPSLEIIAPLSGRSVFTEFLEAHGPGLHHLGYFVPSLDDERERLVARGLSEVQYGGGHGMDGDGKISFFETLDGAASYLELIEPPRRRFPPHFEIRVD